MSSSVELQAGACGLDFETGFSSECQQPGQSASQGCHREMRTEPSTGSGDNSSSGDPILLPGDQYQFPNTFGASGLYGLNPKLRIAQGLGIGTGDGQEGFLKHVSNVPSL